MGLVRVAVKSAKCFASLLMIHRPSPSRWSRRKRCPVFANSSGVAFLALWCCPSTTTITSREPLTRTRGTPPSTPARPQPIEEMDKPCFCGLFCHGPPKWDDSHEAMGAAYHV